jgi:hypothetical protein
VGWRTDLDVTGYHPATGKGRTGIEAVSDHGAG